MDLPRPDFLRSGAENPHLDLPRPGAETIFCLYRGEKFSALGRGESTFGSTAPGRGNDFFLYIGEKNFLRSGAENPPLDLPRPDFLRSGAENPPLDLPRPGAEKIFSLYRGEKFLRSGAENPPLDLPHPGAETIFFSIYGRKFSALGRGESTFGSTAPGFSALGRGESTFGSTAPGRGNDFLSL